MILQFPVCYNHQWGEKVKNNADTLKNSFRSPLDTCLVLALIIPVIFSAVQVKIVKVIGYLVFVFGGISPELYEKLTDQRVPQYLKSLLRSQVVLHSIFGQYLGLYNTLPFWDKLLHFLGSFSVAIFFCYVLSSDSKFWKAELSEKRAIFEAFLLANFAGILWEIAEFTADGFFRVNAQRGLKDTMFDLIFNLIGAYVGSRFLFRTNVIHSESSDQVVKNVRRST